MSSDSICSSLSQECQAIFPGSSVHLFRRGSTGLYRLFEILGQLHGFGEIVVPALCCETVALAALYAGHAVRFADVDENRLCVTPQGVRAAMTPLTRAVVITHLFGLSVIPHDFDTLRAAYPAVAFIDDAAHAVGGRYDSLSEVGSGFDYAMLSFSASKVLAGEGGVIVCHRRSAVARLLDDSPSSSQLVPPHMALLALSLRNLVHSIADLHRSGSPNAAREIDFRLWRRYEPLITIRAPFSDPDRAAHDLRIRHLIRARRRERVAQYQASLCTMRFRTPTFTAEETCWRLPVIADTPDLCKLATATIRAHGFHVSNHYFPLHRLFGGEALPNADTIGDRILNLWVDDSVPPSQITTIARLLNSF